MISTGEIENLLFLDIETAPLAPQFDQLSPRMQDLWVSKSKKYIRQDETLTPEEAFLQKAGIHAEFAQVVCISCGYIRFNEHGVPEISMKSYCYEEEEKVLQAFGEMLEKFTRAKKERRICAHNGKEFDFPFLGRRYVVRGLKIPYVLQVQGKKPWETPFVDTMELWKFGDYKSYTSLDLLAGILDIPSPKDDMDGSQVRAVFWEEKDLERIKIYCEKDVVTTAQVVLRMSRLPLIANT